MTYTKKRRSRGEWITGMHGIGHRIFVAWLAFGWIVLVPMALLGRGS